MSTANFQILLVDDNEPFRRSTAWLLEAADLDVRDFADGPDLLDSLSTVTARAARTCVISDVRMPGMSGLELLEEMRRRDVEVPVVFITAHGDVPMAVEAMRRGASNFLEKPFEGETLVDAVRQAIHEPPPSRRNPAQTEEKLARLTRRERQVLDMVVAGMLNKAIADELDISIKTVELHRANMMGKLGARNVPQLVRLVLGYE